MTRRLLLVLSLSLIVIATGVWTVLNRVEAGGKECGAKPLALIGRSVPYGGRDLAQSIRCRDAATRSVELGFSVIGIGMIMFAGGTVVLVRTGHG